ncbi:MAG: arabinogalactan oligomer / maltooligosaccharide transport system permease protein [Micromonosporaceae bacterium]
MVIQLSRGAGKDTSPHPGTPPRSAGLFGMSAKILLLGVVAALAVWGALPLISGHAWVALGVLVAATALIFLVYLSRRHIPAKYLLPGTLFLIAFQVVPVLYTVSTAFTNYGDAHRGSKQDAVTSIQSASVRQVPGSVAYGLSVATRGDPATGEVLFLLVDPTGKAYAGDKDGLHPLDPGTFTVSFGRITAADGYTLLNLAQASARDSATHDIATLRVPTGGGAILASGITRAYDGAPTRRYDKGCDCVTDTGTGQVWKADNAAGTFVDGTGQRLPQGWKVGVGVSNFLRVVTDARIRGPFLGTLLWNFAFALTVVVCQFALGLLCALAMHADRLRGRSLYRILLVLPYAMPSFAMLLVWTDMFNQDFGLINRLLGSNVDWLGEVWTARLAVIVVQLWLGYPYMFLVATGALQAIPRELTEAAQVDGASAWSRLRAITLPLLLVALAPMLISSFAYNFNNFNAVRLTTEGGPFPATNPSVGATDLLITYTYRLAFGGQGAQYGFAAAVSVYVFTIVAVVSAIGFRRSRRLEEVYT